MKRIFLYLFLVFFYAELFAQSADFIAPAVACLNQNIQLQNKSTGATSYVWDFCHDELENPISTVQPLKTISAADTPEGLTVIFDDGSWYGFIFGRENHSLYRIDFGNSLNNDPSIVNLGNVNNLFNQPTQIKILKDGTQWVGLVSNFNNGKIVRVQFGSALNNNSPTAFDLGSLTGAAGLRDLEMIFDGTNYVTMVANYLTHTISLISFGSTLLNNPTVSNVSVLSNLSSLQNPAGISIVKDNSNWFAVISSYGNSKVFLASFGSNILNTAPQVSVIGIATSPTKVSMIKNGLLYYAFVAGESGLTRIPLGTDLNQTGSINTASLGSFSNQFQNLWGLSLVKELTTWKAIGLIQGTKKLAAINFQEICSGAGIVQNSTTEVNPLGVFYNDPGDYYIELIASSNDKKDRIGKKITVQNTVAPQIDFNVNTYCISVPTIFEIIDQGNQNIQTWDWEFGDNQLYSGNTNVAHQYSSTGSYIATLNVTGAQCGNLVSKEISIYNSPTANFTLPANNPLCTNQELDFSNTSVSDINSVPEWQWFVNDIEVSNTQDLSFAFANATSQSVKLIATIPGCSTEEVQTITSLLQGPVVDFTYLGNCEGDVVQFNGSVQGNANTNTWNFGDGNTSGNLTTQNTYATFGAFTVSLTADNDVGCNNSKTQTILIHSKPIVDFSANGPHLHALVLKLNSMILQPIPKEVILHHGIGTLMTLGLILSGLLKTQNIFFPLLKIMLCSSLQQQSSAVLQQRKK
jgi:PKD repeat protein